MASKREEAFIDLLLGESNSEYFERIRNSKQGSKVKNQKVGRLSKAVKSIQLVGNLSDRSNYKYSHSQVDDIYYTLLSTIFITISKFGKGDVEDRFRRLMNLEIKNIELLEETDRELFNYIQETSPTEISEYIKSKKLSIEKQKEQTEDYLYVAQKRQEELLESLKELNRENVRLKYEFKEFQESLKYEFKNSQEALERKLNLIIEEFNLIEGERSSE